MKGWVSNGPLVRWTDLRRPRERLLTQNGELRPDGIWNWTLPAWVVKLPDGRSFNVCPNAGACAELCYARSGTYRFANVAEAHMKKLRLVLEQPARFERHMTEEVARLPSRTAVRIHDSGDFFSDDYLASWLRIIAATPHVLFYAYTKEVSRFRRLVEGQAPANFRWVFSLGGREDHLLDLDVDRHADVFPDEEAIAAAGYTSQAAHKQGDGTFGTIEASKHRTRS